MGAAATALTAGTVFLAVKPGPAGNQPPPRVQGAAPSVAVTQPARTMVVVDPGQAANIGLTVARAVRSNLTEDLGVVATVVPDESRISHLHTRVSGWIERLYVPNTGEIVRAGQPIADIFSQELYASQVEYLAARALTGPPTAVVESGRARLGFFGMSEGQIRAIENSGRADRLVTLYAPRSGVLAHRGITAGTAVDPSTEIAVIADLTRVWVLAEVPEQHAGMIRKGMTATLSFAGANNTAMPAKVEFIDPMLTEASRTLKVRFSLANPQGKLRPGMYGTASIKAPVRTALTVPREAVIDTGSSQYVYVAEHGGVFRPRAVQLGARLKDTVEIAAGLKESEQIAVSGVFMLDSESRLRASGGQGSAHVGHGAAAPAEHDRSTHAGGDGHD